MTIPAESTSYVVADHGLVTSDDVFDRTGEDVAVMWEAGCEGWAVVEDEFWFGFGLFELVFEG